MSVIDVIRHYQRSIENCAEDEKRMLHCINKLSRLPVTVQHLKETGVGRTVNALRKYEGEVGDAAKYTVTKWKAMVAAEESSDGGGEEEEEEEDEGAGGNDSEREEDHMNGRRQYRTETETESKKMYVANMEEEEEEAEEYEDLARKHDEKRTHNEELIKYRKESNNRIEKETSRLDSSPQKERSHKEKEHSSRKHRESSRTDNVKQPEKKHSQKRKKESNRDHRKEQKRKKLESDNGNTSDSENSGRGDIGIEEQEVEENSVAEESDDSESNYIKESSRTSHAKSNSSSSNSHHHSRHSKESSHKHEKHKERKSHSSDKHTKNNSAKVSENSLKEKHVRHKDGKTEIKNCKPKDTESKCEGKKEKTEHEKHKSQSSSKEDHKKNSKYKLNSSEKVSSSSKPNRSEDSKNKDSKDKKKKSEFEDDDGISSLSGASFAEALGMVDPLVKKKQINSPVSNSSTKTVRSSSSKSSGAVKGNHKTKEMKPPKPPLSSDDEDDDEPARLLSSSVKLEPLDKMDVDLDSTLPEISPNYRPLPHVNLDSLPHRRLKSMTEEEQLSHVLSQKNQRTKVYSGVKSNKSWSTVPSLFEICVRVLQENIDAIEYTGGVPYDLLKPVLNHATPQQLLQLEHYNPYIVEDTDELWEFHCKKMFRMKQREDMETWREMYMRCLEEQEAKLKALTSNIQQSIAKSTPVRQTKLAYVDSVVKPPRNIAKQQAKFGTGRPTTSHKGLPVKAAKNTFSGSAGTSGSASSTPTTSVPPPRPIHSAPKGKPRMAPLMQKTMKLVKSFKR